MSDCYLERQELRLCFAQNPVSFLHKEVANTSLCNGKWTPNNQCNSLVNEISDKCSTCSKKSERL
jgi:hypothetical protein